jgi:hypothetical protein
MKKHLLSLISLFFLIIPIISLAQYANTSLSNLTFTAVNMNLKPAQSRSFALGTPSFTWSGIYIDGSIYTGSWPVFTANIESRSIGIGMNSGTSGNLNTAVGTNALNPSGGQVNSAFGGFALSSNSSGEYNNSFGGGSLLSNTSGSENVAMGVNSLYSNTIGLYNTATGNRSLYSNIDGNGNLAIGWRSLYSNTNGNYNVANGFQSLLNNTTGSYNVGIGWAALYSNSSNSYNVGIGLQAGYHNTSQGTFLGTYADAFDGAYNVTAIGFGAQATANNQVKIGNPSVTSIGGYANWTNFSDGRYKKNIQENVPGLTFINQLKPVTYTLDIDGIENAINKNSQSSSSTGNSLSQIQPYINSGNQATQIIQTRAKNLQPSAQDIIARQQKAKVVYTGFVAQDVEKAAKNLGYDFSGIDVPKNINDFYGLRYADFVIPLVKAVQELSQKNDDLQQQNNKLEQRLIKLENLLNQNSISNNVTLSSASISQNEPNPFNQGTRINYFIPGHFTNASILFYDSNGKLIKTVLVNSSTGILNLDASVLSSGAYQYSLIVDGIKIDAKKMVVAK